MNSEGRGIVSVGEPFGDVVVVIPGILGSRLVRREAERETTVWDLSLAALPRVLKDLLRGGLSLGEFDGPSDDGVEAVELFRYQLLPGFFGVDDYRPLLESLRAVVGSERQLLTFPYDWRRSNRFAAQRLEAKALDALATWKQISGNRDAKLWLVCHSMGGLVARYFCEYLGGAAHTRAVITIGTPHRGSVKALDALVNGVKLGPVDLSKLVRTLPSVYELLPLFPVVRVGAERAGSPLDLRRVADFFSLDAVSGANIATAGNRNTPEVASPLNRLDRDEVQRALQFHARIREPAEARAAAGEECPYRQEAFFNRRQRTFASARLVGQRLTVLDNYPYERDGEIQDKVERGDGTVPAFSSLPIEWVNSGPALALGDKHASMQSALALRETLLNWMRPLDVRGKKGGAEFDDDSVVELNLPPLIQAGADLEVQTASLRPMNITVHLEQIESGATRMRPVSLPGGDAYRTAAFRSLPPGVHRVTAVPSDRRLPSVSDYVFVLE